MLNDSRQAQLITWLNHVFTESEITLVAMSGDAGFRRYFRFTANNQAYIAVDSPAQWCNNSAFVAIQQRFAEAQIQVPVIVAEDEAAGFFCLSDLGDVLLSDIVTERTMEELYQQAIDILPTLSSLECNDLPEFDGEFVQRELTIFTEWLVNKHLSLTLSEQEQQQLAQCFSVLTASALAQPQVLMHRDFHSRNIMQTNGQLAVIDFQDAVKGPITYDIVSLLRDCYLKWPNEQVLSLFSYFITLQASQHHLANITAEQWQKWFDLMGLQRHLKASGIFARLHHRDNKPNYLKDIPLTLSYIVDISQQYSELAFLGTLVSQRVLPALSLLAVKDK